MSIMQTLLYTLPGQHSFLGSPQMNLVDAAITRKDGRCLVDGGGLLALVDEERFGDALEQGRGVVAGVRPHDFTVADPKDAVATLNWPSSRRWASRPLPTGGCAPAVRASWPASTQLTPSACVREISSPSAWTPRASTSSIC